jgi:uncharacterized protein (TIGR03083 family)
MNVDAASLEPILCAHLLRKVDAKLIELLRSLEQRDWDLETVSPLWRVRDVAAHLLDTALRKLSLVRDAWLVETGSVETAEIRSETDLVPLVNRLNREGVAVYRRLSPAVLISMMETACEQSAAFHESLDPFAPALFNVSWAGESQSLNWFDTARELTERWHHQQQIRLATGRPGIMTLELYHPVLDCFLRGLPHRFRNLHAPEGTIVEVEIEGECGGTSWLIRQPGNWELVAGASAAPASRISIPQEIAWRVFTKGIAREDALKQVLIDGDRALGEHVLTLTAIVA